MSTHPKARFALHALDIYREIVEDQDEPYSTVIRDLLADLMHLWQGDGVALAASVKRPLPTSIMRSPSGSRAYVTSDREGSPRGKPLPEPRLQVLGIPGSSRRDRVGRIEPRVGRSCVNGWPDARS